MACLQICRELLSLATFLRVHSNLEEVSYLSSQNTYPNLKTASHIKLKFFLWTKLHENLLLARYLISVAAPLRFLNKNSQSQQILAKKLTHSTIQVRSKNLTDFTNLNSLDIENNMLLQLHHFLTPKNYTLQENVCIFLYISVGKFLFQRRSKILSGGGVGWGMAEEFP